MREFTHFLEWPSGALELVMICALEKQILSVTCEKNNYTSTLVMLFVLVQLQQDVYNYIFQAIIASLS